MALLDAVRQRGLPDVYYTIAPSDHILPYHEHVLHDLHQVCVFLFDIKGLFKFASYRE